MKRITCAVAAIGLLVGACGSGDDEPAADEPAAGEAPADEPAADESSAEEPAAEEPPAEDPPAEDPPAEDPPATDDDDDDNGGGTRISSINDVPEECRQEMAEFLRKVEPIVSPIDWETATLNDFQEISGDFDRISDDFSTSSNLSGCDDLDFVADNEFEVLIEFARDEAPGTVGFFEFFSTLGAAVGLDDDGDGGDAGGDDALTTCDDVITFVQGLLDNYDSINDVPAAEAFKFAQSTSALGTCTPEQLSFLDSDEFAAFFDG